MSRVILLHRWKKGYEAFIQKDYSVAFSMFELIEMTFIDKSSIPKEIIMNRILCLIALKNYAHAVEVGSKLLRSELGSFFLFAVGLHQEKVNKELAFSSFKKCLLVRSHSLIMIVIRKFQGEAISGKQLDVNKIHGSDKSCNHIR
jgi:hypothetical protein